MPPCAPPASECLQRLPRLLLPPLLRRLLLLLLLSWLLRRPLLQLLLWRVRPLRLLLHE